MKTLFIFLLLIFTIQIVRADGIAKCKSSANEANADLKKGKIRFMIQGGIAPTYQNRQEIFEKNYKVVYFDMGCVVPENLCLKHYNAQIAKFLDRKYGKGWRKTVRKDIEGV